MGRARAGRVLLCLAAAVVPSARQAPAGEGFGARVEVAVALYAVRVLDENRCIAARVAPGDVLVFAGGRALPTTVRRARGPLRLLVVVDASFSMVGRRLAVAERAAERLIERLDGDRRGNQAGVAVFDDEVYWLTPEGFTRDLCAVAARVTEPVAGGGTALWRSIQAALDLGEAVPSRAATAIVVITDGQDNSDRGGVLSERVRRRAVEQGIPIFAVVIPPRRAVVAIDEPWEASSDVRCSRGEWVPRRLDRERERLLRACLDSGGAMYAPGNAQGIGEVVDFLFAQIRDLHWVEAEIPPEIAARDPAIEVAATRRGFSVLSGGALRAAAP